MKAIASWPNYAQVDSDVSCLTNSGGAIRQGSDCSHARIGTGSKPKTTV